MRKTSQDGGDTTSITSGIENEIKKPAAILKTKRNSIKRKVQNFSHESDETVTEPLLQKDKEKSDILNQSAKYNLSKTKTDSNSDRVGDKDKLIQDVKSSMANVSNVENNTLPTSMKEASTSKFTTTGPLHNHMNTNIFSSHDSGKGFVAPKTQILVEIDGSKQGGYSPSPLIFTTAKIHTDGKTKHMEPVQVTPVPISSTIEVSLLKSGSIKGETSGLVNSNISAVYSTIPKSNINVTEKDQKTSFKTVENTPTPPYIVGTKVLISGEKTAVTSTEQTKNSISSLTTKDPATNQSKLNTSNLKKDSSMGNKSIGEKDDQTKVSTPQTTKSIILDETKKSVVTCEPTKLMGTVNTKASSINDNSKTDGNINQALTAANTKADEFKYPEKKTESSNNPTAFGSIKTQKSDNVNPDKTTLNSSTSTNSRQLQRQNIVIDTDDPNLKLEDHFNPSAATKNSIVSSQKSHEFQKSSFTIKSTGNDSISSGNKTILPKQNANNVPASKVPLVPISTAANVNKTAGSNSTPASVYKSSAPVTTTVGTSKTSTPIFNTVPAKNPPASASNSQGVNKSSTPITRTVSKLPSSIANTTVDKISPVNTTTTVGDNKTSTHITAAVPVNKMKTDFSKSSSMATTTGGKKVVTSIPTSSIKANNTSSTVPTSSNKLNSKSTVFTTPSTESSTTIKNNAADAFISGSSIKSETTNLNSTTKTPVTSTVNAKSTASTINTKAKVSSNTAVQPNAATAVKSPTGIKSSTAVTSKSVTQPKTVSKLDNAKERGGKSSTSKINTTVTPGVTNVSVPTTTTALDSSVTSSNAAASNKKNDSKSNELSNGCKFFKA